MPHTADPFAVAEPDTTELAFSAVVGALVASACADALGWPTESMRSPKGVREQFGMDTLTDFVGWRKNVGGRFNTYIDYIAPGEYSDDTQLMLCLARSIRTDGTLDQDHFAKRELASWLDYSRGAGRTITAAAKKITRRVDWNKNFFRDGSLDYRDSGANGAAMRIAPLALANLGDDHPPLEDAFCNAIVTHGHPRAHIGTLAFVSALHRVGRAALEQQVVSGSALASGTVDDIASWWHGERSSATAEWLDLYDAGGDSYARGFEDTLVEFVEQLDIAVSAPTDVALQELGCHAPQTRGSGTGTVAAGIHLFVKHGTDVEGAITAAANGVGTDTDTIGVFAGALTGAYAGYTRIPERWTSKLQDLPYFLAAGGVLARLATGDESAGTLRPRTRPRDEDSPELLPALRQCTLQPGDRVQHPVLGPGWVTALHAQQVRRRAGGQIAYARVALDIGQQCQFRVHIPASR